jgi:signal recognition particle subunit SRP54
VGKLVSDFTKMRSLMQQMGRDGGFPGMGGGLPGLGGMPDFAGMMGGGNPPGQRRSSSKKPKSQKKKKGFGEL